MSLIHIENILLCISKWRKRIKANIAKYMTILYTIFPFILFNEIYNDDKFIDDTLKPHITQ